MERLPSARSAALEHKPGMMDDVVVDGRGVAEQQRRPYVRTRDRRMTREQPVGAVRATVGRRFDESIDRIGERERHFFDVIAKRVPGGEAVLPREGELRVVEGERARRFLRAKLAQPLFRLSLELIEVRALG